MKLPSIKIIFEGIRKTVVRFPLAAHSSFIGTVSMIKIIGLETTSIQPIQHLYNLVMVCTLGIPFLMSLSLISERFSLNKKINYLIQAISTIILILYYYSLPSEFNITDFIRFLLFILSAHLLVSVSTNIMTNIFSSRETKLFWQFNQVLFIRVLTTGLYSGTLYIGLTIAILSFDTLFNTHLNNKIYAQLFFGIIGIFGTLFFLSGTPEKTEELENSSVYPKGLKLFTQYVLLPLVLVYFLILYLYTGKIIVDWELPYGWVSYLILGFSIAGILSLLLIHPLKELEENRWIKIISKWFYLALFPLIVLLFTAILKRTSEYGITENRYFVFVLACWLTAIAIYFTFSRIKNIKLIPVSLCIISIMVSFGPWGVFAVSERSQVSRIEEILSKNSLLLDGKINKATDRNKNISEVDARDLSSIVRYFSERKKLNVIQQWFSENLDSIKVGNENGVYKSKEEKIIEIIGVDYIPERKNSKGKYFNYIPKDYNKLDIRGYDYFVKYTFRFTDTASTNTIIIDTVKYKIDFDKETNFIKISGENEKIECHLNLLIEKIKNSNSPEIMQENMSSEITGKNLKMKIFIYNLSGENDKEKIKINYLQSEIFLKRLNN
jgi:hypothetical protein